MITAANCVKLNCHKLPRQSLTASPQLTHLGSTQEVVTGNKMLQIMYHNIKLRKGTGKPNVNPICGERRVGLRQGKEGKS